ncbi:ABA4-like family protein [Fontibacter flavus]|uniref:ABA4-like family protein n=1 Tax=Fontibacter flavus TaxID=654838 RepID=A0ABV6FMY7_9BACT
MTLEAIFGMASLLAIFSWIALFIFYPSKWIYQTLFSGVLIVLGIMYLFYLFTGIGSLADFNFDSLEQVRTVFSSDEALLAGWIHYLAFDLFVGMWISKDSWEKNISRWVLLPCLLFTFMMGPIGLMLYFIVRAIKTKKLNQSPFH